MRLALLHIGLLVCWGSFASARDTRVLTDSLPPDLPLPTITTLKSPSDGYIFAAVPYWGNGGKYLVVYDNSGRPVFNRKTEATCTDFKLQENGLLTYFDYAPQKFFALDSTLSIVDSFWVQNGFTTDEHDLKILPNGNVLLIGYAIKFFDMRQYVQGGDPNASVIVNVVQEIDRRKNVVFEWKAADHYKITDVGPEVNLLDPAFVYTHINSVCVDLDGNLVISARNLDEITKVDRKSGNIIWRLGGKNNQFKFVNDTIGFSAQHSASVLPNRNLLVYDNGLFHKPPFSRAIEYHLDTLKKTAELVWSYRNTPDMTSAIWGNAQRLKNGNTFISWGQSSIAATEVTPEGEKVFEMTFPEGVYSYRIFRFPFSTKTVVAEVSNGDRIPDFGLGQNYPNPFNPATTIGYQLPAPSGVEGPAISHASLKVFDVLGREVAVLVDEIQAEGKFTVHFDGSNLPSGIYISRLVVEPLSGGQPGVRTLSRKMVLLK